MYTLFIIDRSINCCFIELVYGNYLQIKISLSGKKIGYNLMGIKYKQNVYINICQNCAEE